MQKTDKFVEFIYQKSTKETRTQIKNFSKDIENLRKRNTELSKLFKRLYEDNVLGKITNEAFRMLSDDYVSEQKEIQITLPKMENDLENLKNSLINTDKFLERAKEYTDLKALTPELLRSFVDKVLVHKRGSNRKIEIHYRDIGYLADYTKETDITAPPYDFVLSKTGELICINEELLQIA